VLARLPDIYRTYVANVAPLSGDTLT
jgi:hypothetical protein